MFNKVHRLLQQIMEEPLSEGPRLQARGYGGTEAPHFLHRCRKDPAQIKAVTSSQPLGSL